MLAVKVKTTIVDTIAEINPEAFIVDIELKRSNNSTLFVRVDTDQGISLAACSKISRSLGRKLDEMKEMDFPYRLEVSSPGVGFPLKLHRQYIQNVGRCLRVTRLDGEIQEGVLLEVDAKMVQLGPLPIKGKKKKNKKAKAAPAEHDTGPKQIAFSEIKESKVIIV